MSNNTFIFLKKESKTNFYFYKTKKTETANAH